jgi:very-short-patch-repair endonuclease
MRHVDAKVASDLVIAGIAERQHGVVSVQQLYRAGISRNAVRRRVQSGRLHRVHRAVYAVGHPRLVFEGRCMAAVLACGSLSTAAAGRTVLDRWGAAVSHRSAAVLWGLLVARDGPIDVSVPSDSGRGRRREMRLHRCSLLSPAAVTLRKGIPVTTVARTIADLRRAASRPGRGTISQRELRRATRQADVLGLPLGEEVGDRTRSDLERDFLRLCRRHGLPTPEVNVFVGRNLVDFLWREHRLVVETDGYVYHRGRTAFEDDRERDMRLRARGFDVMRVSEKQVDEEPERVAEVLAAALRVGADG